MTMDQHIYRALRRHMRRGLRWCDLRTVMCREAGYEIDDASLRRLIRIVYAGGVR